MISRVPSSRLQVEGHIVAPVLDMYRYPHRRTGFNCLMKRVGRVALSVQVELSHGLPWICCAAIMPDPDYAPGALDSPSLSESISLRRWLLNGLGMRYNIEANVLGLNVFQWRRSMADGYILGPDVEMLTKFLKEPKKFLFPMRHCSCWQLVGG